MDQESLARLAAATRTSLEAFAAERDDPVLSLANLADEIDLLFDAAQPGLTAEQVDLADELHAILLDQIAIVQRAQTAGRSH